MAQITMTLPDKASLALKVPPGALGSELLLAAAVKLYELGKLSSRLWDSDSNGRLL